MAHNLKLGLGMAYVYGFTQTAPQGAYFPRDMLVLPSVNYCRLVLHLARENAKRKRLQ